MIFFFSWKKIKQNQEIGNARNGMDGSILILYTMDTEGFRDKMKFKERAGENKEDISGDSRGREP